MIHFKKKTEPIREKWNEIRANEETKEDKKQEIHEKNTIFMYAIENKHKIWYYVKRSHRINLEKESWYEDENY